MAVQSGPAINHARYDASVSLQPGSAAGNLCLTALEPAALANEKPRGETAGATIGSILEVVPSDRTTGMASQSCDSPGKCNAATQPQRWQAGRTMDDYLRIDDLSAADLRAILSADLDQLEDDEVLAIKDFVVRVGGVRNARMAVEMLNRLEDAA